MQVNDLITEGKLYEAVALLSEELKQKPQAFQSRQLLAELLCIAREWPRSDNQFDIFINQNPNHSEILLYRWLIKAEQLRWNCFNTGALPGFVAAPTHPQQLILKALIEKRSGNIDKAGQLLIEAKNLLPTIQGACNGEPFTGLMDGDNWCLNSLEVLTSKGEYYWIPMEMIKELTMYPIKYLIDSYWRRGHLTLPDGTEGDIYIPSIYINTPKESEQGLLGHITDWVIQENQSITGIGQRILIAGDNQIPIRELQHLLIESIE